jgi:3-hexulose-6-phosphate synthase
MSGTYNAPKLQLALDVGETTTLVSFARLIEDFIDWLEAGTPWILAEGMHAVRALRTAFPEKKIVADMKIVDGGYYEASMGYHAGANLVTVLGTANDITIRGVIQAARDNSGQVIVDLLQIPNLLERANQLDQLGVDYLCIHTAYDLHGFGHDPIADLEKLSSHTPIPLIVAGGIGLHNISEIIAFRPKVVIVGGALTKAVDPLSVVKRIHQIITDRNME